MQITGININPILNFQGRKRKPVFLPNGMLLTGDVFEKRKTLLSKPLDTIKETWAEKYLNTLGNQEEQLNKNGAFTPVEVPFGVDKDILKSADKISSKEIKNMLTHVSMLAKETAYLANITENMLDEEYGENNWVFVSIGTSPSGIAKALQIKGHDVRYVPITSLGTLRDASYLSKQKGKDDYKNYLDKIGLNKNAISKDKRNFVVCDYTGSGSTLENVRFIARKMLGITSDNVDYYSINKALLNYAIDNPRKIDYDLVTDLIEKHMGFGIIGEISGVPHLPYKNLENIYLLLTEGKNIAHRDFETALAYYIKSEN